MDVWRPAVLSSRAPRRPWYDAPRSMLKGFTHARLACGCRIAFREGVEGSPVTVVVDEKSPGCTLTLHVRDLPLFDYREALRPSTRLGPPEEEEYEEEGWVAERTAPTAPLNHRKKAQININRAESSVTKSRRRVSALRFFCAGRGPLSC